MIFAASAAVALGALARFDIPPLPPEQALLRFASQAGVSIGGDFRSCGQTSVNLRGNLTVEAGLRRLLASTACVAVRSAPGAFVVRPKIAVQPRTRRSTPEVTAAVSEVVVTADRRSTPLNRFAGSVAVAHVDTGDAATGRDLASLVGSIPMLSATNLGPGRDKYFLRGVSDGVFSGASLPTVSTYLDDLPLTYNAPDPDLKLVDVDRVEVLAGPQGALYGAGAIAGVLHIVTRAPDVAAANGEIATEVSSTAHGGLGRGVDGYANVPLLAHTLALRVSGYAEADPGWLDNPILHRSDTNTTRRAGGRAALLWRMTDRWSVVLTVAGQSLKTADAQYVEAGFSPLVRAFSRLEPHNDAFGSLSATLKGELPRMGVRLSLARIVDDSTTRYDAEAQQSVFGIGSDEGSAVYDERNRRTLTFGELEVTSPKAELNDWRLGLFVAASSDRAHDGVGVTRARAAAYEEVRSDAADEQAVFAEYGLHLGRRLTFRIGGRLSHATLATRSRLSQTALSDHSRLFSADADDLRFLPRLALELQLSRQFFLYFDATSGYRPQGFNTAGPIGQTFNAPGAPARIVRADDARSFELGARWRGAPRLQVSGSLFYTDWLGVRSDQYAPNGLPFAVNVGDATIDGAQVAVDWSSPGGIELRGSAFAAEPQLTRDRNLAFPSRSDAGLPGVSSLGAALDAGWSHRLTPELTARIDVRADYVGRSTISFDAANSGRYGDYLETAFTAELRRGVWALRLDIHNLADQRADTFAFGNPFSLSRGRQLTPERPRTATIRLSESF